MTVFNCYAHYYDLLYREKDYPREADYVHALIAEYAASPVRTILDLGCGTGKHAIELARKGYNVTGVDRSDAMLAVAKENKRQTEGSIEFTNGDICTMRLSKRFDAAIAMFAVMGYQTSNARLEGALRTVWHHLNPDGLFIFDAWFGPAVIAQKPHDRVVVVEEAGGTVIRLTRPVLNVLTHTVSVNFTVLHIENGVVRDHIAETHEVRFFFPKELEFMFATTGFEVLGMHPFMKLSGDLTENDWNMTVIAKKVTR
ncbi:MAG: class I SAM-dependent DNA methyltransferase [Halobacteriota archaeon]